MFNQITDSFSDFFIQNQKLTPIGEQNTSFAVNFNQITTQIRRFMDFRKALCWIQSYKCVLSQH